MEVLLQDDGSQIFISDEVFGSVFNKSLVHQVVTSYQSGSRQGTRAQKSRSEVSGSGKKPWRQKGTGRARSGSIRSPIWRSGGVTFAAKPKIYRKKINKKMYRGALKNILSELIRQDRLIFMNRFYLKEAKTRMLINKLKEIKLQSDVLIIINEVNKNLYLASRNLYKVRVCHVSSLDPLVLISFNKIIITLQSIKSIEDMLI